MSGENLRALGCLLVVLNILAWIAFMVTFILREEYGWAPL